MVSIGYFLPCGEFGPHELVRQATLAERAGFERLWISDHFHPWNDEQGNSPFAGAVRAPQFEQASSLGSREAVEAAVPCGPDVERSLRLIERFAECGYDEVHVQQIGPEQDSFFQAWQQKILPRVQHR